MISHRKQALCGSNQEKWNSRETKPKVKTILRARDKAVEENHFLRENKMRFASLNMKLLICSQPRDLFCFFFRQMCIDSEKKKSWYSGKPLKISLECNMIKHGCSLVLKIKQPVVLLIYFSYLYRSSVHEGHPKPPANTQQSTNKNKLLVKELIHFHISTFFNGVFSSLGKKKVRSGLLHCPLGSSRIAKSCSRLIKSWFTRLTASQSSQAHEAIICNAYSFVSKADDSLVDKRTPEESVLICFTLYSATEHVVPLCHFLPGYYWIFMFFYISGTKVPPLGTVWKILLLW